MKNKLFAFLAFAFLATRNSQLSTSIAQVTLTPPGAPAPTMRTLDQIEPRTPISSVPGNFPVAWPAGRPIFRCNLSVIHPV